MGLRVNTNVASLNAQRHLYNTTTRFGKSMERLSSGLRINRSGDDAAGLAISESLKSDIRALQQASRNAADGISLVQTAEGSLDEVNNILLRLRELAEQSATETLGEEERTYLDAEFQELLDEINRISATAEFNGIKLLDGTSSTVNFQVGIGTTASIDQISVSLSPALSTSLSLNSLDIGSAGDTSTAISTIDTAINSISSLRGKLGATQNRLNSTINNLSVQSENLQAANSRIRDVDVAFETAELTRNSILQQAAISILAQANTQPQAALQLLQG